LIVAGALCLACAPADAAKLGYSRAWCLSETLTARETISACTAVLQKFRKNTDALVRRGLAFSELGQLEYAIGDFSRALRIDAKKASAFYRLRQAVETEGGPYENLEAHKRGLELKLSRRQTREAVARVAVAVSALASGVDKRERKAPNVGLEEEARPAERGPPPSEDLSFLIVPAFLTLMSLAVLVYLAVERESERGKGDERPSMS
jgi:tetratricopeptide (TPR) repeat protein